jgi:hypothetical protein
MEFSSKHKLVAPTTIEEVATMKFGFKTLVVGCTYNLTWQQFAWVSWTLLEIIPEGEKAIVSNTKTKRTIPTGIDTLIFLMSDRNKARARRILTKQIKTNERATKAQDKKTKRAVR